METLEHLQGTENYSRFERPEILLKGQNKLLRMVAEGKSPKEVLNKLILFMEDQSRRAICSVLLLDPSKSILRFAAAPSLPQEYNDYVDGLKVGPQNGSCGTAIYRGNPVFVSSIDSDPLWEAARPFALKYGLKACTSLPIFDSQGEPVGTFAFYYTEEILPDNFDMSLMEVSRDLAGVAIERARHEEALEALYLRELEARKQAELLNRAKDEFISVASHELKTPIAGMKMQIELTMMKTLNSEVSLLDDEYKEDLLRLNKLCDRLIKLNDNLLDVARIRSMNFKMELESLDLVEVLQDLIEEYVQYRGHLKLIAPRPVVGFFDRQRVEQVIVNLIDNAIKFSKDQPIELSVGTEDSKAVFTVEDHGIGISDEEKGRIFNRFEQLDTRLDVRGLGLGLYIVVEIIRAHGGSIELKSELGKGSTFTVLLPLNSNREFVNVNGTPHRLASRGQ